MTSTPPRPRQTSRYYAPGEVIGAKYELVRPLGEGGMGAVWLARNLALDSVVALKLLRAELDADDAGERLMQEARAAARIGHRAIVRVFDFGHTEQGDPFLVMELLEGESLGDVLGIRGRLNPVKAIQILLPVIDALAAAHAHGIVHRDIKPDNIFLAREQRKTQPKVVDFGIAKVERTGSSRTLTRQGTVLGSPGYMSPEQARGLVGIDHRTDIWSVCVVLYECITAESAFAGDNYNALMRAIIEDAVVPSINLSAGDWQLWMILEKGLRKSPGERWTSMHELGAELAGWLLSHGTDHDVCGEPILGFLEGPVAPRPRDILSIAPPSGLGGKRSPSGSDTLDQLVAESGVQPTRDSRRGTRYSNGPESTSAVSNSKVPTGTHRRPAMIGGVAAVAAMIAILVVSFVGRIRSTPAAASAASAALPVRAATSDRVPDSPHLSAPSAVPVISPSPAPVVAPNSVPTSPTGTLTKKPAAGTRPAAITPRAAKPVAIKQSDQSDLKDPY